jgi:GNAT superfamily N-acetyltransferase
MIKTNIYDASRKPGEKEKKDIIEFLYTHLEEFGDARKDIARAVDYALQEIPSFGGFLITSIHGEEISGAVVVNRTGMQGYIPENILVYIATHKDFRGQGIGKELMKKSINHADGDVALHVEPENPAKYLYEKVGFTNKYLEMRYQKSVHQN